MNTKKLKKDSGLKTEIVKPFIHTTITYSGRDIEKITGFGPIYTFVREGSASLDYFTDGRGNRKTTEEMKDILLKYLKENKFLSEESKSKPFFKASHYFSYPDEEGCRSSVYETEMKIIL